MESLKSYLVSQRIGVTETWIDPETHLCIPECTYDRRIVDVYDGDPFHACVEGVCPYFRFHDPGLTLVASFDNIFFCRRAGTVHICDWNDHCDDVFIDNDSIRDERRCNASGIVLGKARERTWEDMSFEEKSHFGRAKGQATGVIPVAEQSRANPKEKQKRRRKKLSEQTKKARKERAPWFGKASLDTRVGYMKMSSQLIAVLLGEKRMKEVTERKASTIVRSTENAAAEMMKRCEADGTLCDIWLVYLIYYNQIKTVSEPSWVFYTLRKEELAAVHRYVGTLILCLFNLTNHAFQKKAVKPGPPQTWIVPFFVIAFQGLELKNQVTGVVHTIVEKDTIISAMVGKDTSIFSNLVEKPFVNTLTKIRKAIVEFFTGMNQEEWMSAMDTFSVTTKKVLQTELEDMEVLVRI